jgi:UDP-N-acetylmuramoyl-L-alanyl-D-glutamate--2,6-diaminopimelate ligase
MKLREILNGLELNDCRADLDAEIRDISYDSRATMPGDLFVAITGFESDGHDFICAAREKGAAAVVCQKAPDCEIPYIIVEDSRYALAIASKNYFRDPAGGMKLVGVTGTNGKTTSTMLIKHILEQAKNVNVGLVGTNKNMIKYRDLPTERTTPESYELYKLLREMADEGCEYVVMEVSSHSLVLNRVAGLRFAAGIFTNLTQDHLDFHKTMEEYGRAKARLFDQCEKGAVNLDDEYAQMMIDYAKCPIMTFSTVSNEAGLVAKDVRLFPDSVKFCALTTGILERVYLGIPGRFSVYNALAAISCGLLLGLTASECAEALKTAKGVKGRAEVVPSGGDYTILIDYAHTPDALENIIRSMKEVTQGRVVILFGCGGDRDRTKRPKMGAIAAKYADFVIVTSDNPRTEVPSAIIEDIMEGVKGTKTPYTVIEDRREAIAWAIDNHQPGDVIILAGKGHETYQIVGKTKHHMDEREIVAEHLAM